MFCAAVIIGLAAAAMTGSRLIMPSASVPAVVAELPDEDVVPAVEPWKIDKRALRGKRGVVFGATGSVGRGFVDALLDANVQVVAVMRRPPNPGEMPAGVLAAVGDLDDEAFMTSTLAGKPDLIVSALASRTGLPDDVRRVFELHERLFAAAQIAGVGMITLVTSFCGALAAELPFHQALLNTERVLIDTAATRNRSRPKYLIIRPTSFFENFLRKAMPDMLAGRTVTVIVPPGGQRRHMMMAAADVGRFAVTQLAKGRHNTILQVGGTRAITYRQGAQAIGAVAGATVRFSEWSLEGFDRLIRGMELLDFLKSFFFESHVAHYLKIARYFNVVPMQCADTFTTISLEQWAAQQLSQAGDSNKRLL